MDAGLLIVRLAPGLLLVGHGCQKLFGWFGGRGLRATATSFDALGYRPGLPMAFLAGFGEAGGGLLLAAGFLTPLAVAAVVGVMANAIVSVHLKNGLWNTNKGFEFPLTFAVVATGVGFTGPGRLSLDHAVGLAFRGPGWGWAALGVGLAAGIVTLLLRWRSRRGTTSARAL